MEILEQVLEEYHWHWHEFSEKASHCYLLAWDEDHTITMKPGAPATMSCKIYPKMDKEMEATQEFINEYLAREYIKESNSPYTSPIFYCAKKDGTLCLIMDYHLLNSWTVCDTYPLPLINDIITTYKAKPCSTNLTSGGDTIIYVSKRKTDGLQCSKHLSVYTNLPSCTMASPTCQLLSAGLWGKYSTN